MSIWSNIWGSLVLNATRGATDIGSGTNLSYRYKKSDNTLIYRKHRTYKSSWVQAASRIAIQTAMNEINQLYPNYLKKLQKEKRQVTFASQMQNLTTLIKNQRIMIDEGFGTITDPDSGNSIVAVDKYGNLVSEALMLYYEGDEAMDALDYWSEDKNDKGQYIQRKASFRTTTICHIDLAPDISLNSSKNIILTPVQGRDFSRKELVAGGDLTFSVNGNIVCDQPGVYPTAAVQRFVKTMQYGGILTVHHFQFKQLEVTKVLVKDWSLGTQEYKNIQPYSFTCVAVEPDEELQIKDTIQELNKDLAYAPTLGLWERLLMDEKFKQIAQNAMTNLLNSSISTLTDMTSGQI